MGSVEPTKTDVRCTKPEADAPGGRHRRLNWSYMPHCMSGCSLDLQVGLTIAIVNSQPYKRV